jgi:hypothetical protein
LGGGFVGVPNQGEQSFEEGGAFSSDPLDSAIGFRIIQHFIVFFLAIQVGNVGVVHDIFSFWIGLNLTTVYGWPVGCASQKASQTA